MLRDHANVILKTLFIMLETLLHYIIKVPILNLNFWRVHSKILLLLHLFQSLMVSTFQSFLWT